MADYGHELQFGIFITPAADQAQAVLELAKLAEVAGLDLVTFQDHPYQSRFLDTWTLLSVVAAQTSSVRVAPNVANLPLRQPVVLARSVASLDILSGGRVELGLGAGAFWDAIAAVGGNTSSSSRWLGSATTDPIRETCSPEHSPVPPTGGTRAGRYRCHEVCRFY
jgi:alkanesulfonate monooxygenase SsuD/methylene tetrahydromethanopterin reductase-like flavin-dependent oxidoreductase (luciferase family)